MRFYLRNDIVMWLCLPWLQSPYPVEIGSLGNTLEPFHTFLLPSKKRINPQVIWKDLNF